MRHTGEKKIKTEIKDDIEFSSESPTEYEDRIEQSSRSMRDGPEHQEKSGAERHVQRSNEGWLVDLIE